MTAKSQAIKDIKNDLRKQGRCFLAFHKELDAIMASLVNNQISSQFLVGNRKGKSQLMASCFFSKGKVKYTNYQKYHKDEK